MKTKDTLAYFLAVVAWILLAVAISGLDLWSSVSNWTIPWFCSALALALLIIFTMNVVSGTPPSQMKLSVILLVYGVIVLIGTAGIAFDNFSMPTFDDFGVVQKWNTDRFVESLVEWSGLSLILLVLLLVPRLNKSVKKNSNNLPPASNNSMK